MQYGNNFNDYEKMLLDGNSGDYANSWLFGDTNTNEILRIELGLKYHNIERTKNGVAIKNLETPLASRAVSSP